MIKVLCVGHIKEKYLNELINDYKDRIFKYHKITIIEVKDNNDKNVETELLLKNINNKDYNIACTLDGETYDSKEFAKFIDKTFITNSNITFIIGGSNGLDEKVINNCDKCISFSNFTFPHGLFRGILLEQTYRAFKIINNESYHK